MTAMETAMKVLGMVLGCVMVAALLVGCSSDDEESPGDTGPAETSPDAPAPASGEPESAAGEGSATSWCARTAAVLDEIDNQVGYDEDAADTWVDEAPAEVAALVEEYAALVGTAPPIAAADPDHETNLADARAEIDAYVSENC